eukprot:scaffold153220_cov68-Attheya_sp.AAC.5
MKIGIRMWTDHVQCRTMLTGDSSSSCSHPRRLLCPGVACAAPLHNVTCCGVCHVHNKRRGTCGDSAWKLLHALPLIWWTILATMKRLILTQGWVIDMTIQQAATHMVDYIGYYEEATFDPRLGSEV